VGAPILSIKRIAGTKWTPEQDALLRALFAEGKNDFAISDVFGCTDQAVEARRRALGIKRGRGRVAAAPGAPKPDPRWRLWTAEEDEIIASVGYVIEEAMKLLPHRSRGAIEHRIWEATRDDKKGGSRWSAEEVRTLEANASRTLPEIAALLPGRSTGAVFSMLGKLGIYNRHIPASEEMPDGTVFETSAGIRAIRRKGISVPYIPSLYGPGAMITC
jgi:hypothetical protein